MIYNKDYRGDGTLYKRVWKETIKKKTMKEKECKIKRKN